jgi:AmiR/NasT family two-component response regulator
MAQGSPPHHARALIVEDEVFFAINLEADMHALGFDICDLAANGHQASMLAMSNQPLVFITGYADRETIKRIHELVPDAPVLTKLGYHNRLADAVAAAAQHQH